MTGWLYLMMAHTMAHKDYNDEVREGVNTPNFWIQRLVPLVKGRKPRPEDTIILFYGWSKEPQGGGGIYGWGKIKGYGAEDGKTIEFEPLKPSDYLKKYQFLDD
jgi:hypothetical protein